MIGLSLSGGGSRAIAFHLGCLRALNDMGVLEKIGVLSTISGGSVIGALYAYSPDLTFPEFDERVVNLLHRGFHRDIFWEIIKPKNLLQSTSNLFLTKISQIVARIRKVPFGRIRYPTRTDFFARILTRDVFPRTTVSGRRQNNLDVVIGACELRTGTAFRFGNTATGGWRQGSLIGLDPEVGLAVAASAAYPILLPSIERNWTFSYNGQQIERRVLIIDGGVYDNLGINVLEPDRNPEISLHTFPCDYLIVCNAGQGQSPGYLILQVTYLELRDRSK